MATKIVTKVNSDLSTTSFVDKANGGFGADVSTGLTNDYVAVVAGGAITIGPAPAQDPTLAGDVTGPSSANTVVGLQTNPLSAAAPSDLDAVMWDAGGSTWLPKNPYLTQIAMTGDYLIGQPAPFALPIGSYQRTYVDDGGYSWISTNCSWDGSIWTKDANASAASLFQYDYLGNITTYTQVADAGVTTWDHLSWATSMILDNVGNITADGDIDRAFGAEAQFANNGYLGNSISFGKTFVNTPLSFTFTIASSNNINGTPNAYSIYNYGCSWYVPVFAASDVYIAGTVKISA